MAERKKILIIDDEIDLCLLLKSYLLRKGFDVYLSHTLGEGIAFLKSLEPDIIFIDNNLPDGTGWSVAPELAKTHPNMHINLISAFHPILPEMPEGASYTLLEKPISLTDLDKQLTALTADKA